MFRKIIQASPPNIQVFLAFTFGLASNLIVLSSLTSFPDTVEMNLLRQALGMITIFLMPALMLLNLRGETPNEAWRLMPRADWRLILPAVLVMPLFMDIGEWLYVEISSWTNVPEWWVSMREASSASGGFFTDVLNGPNWVVGLGALLIVVIGPIAEEFFFRGTVQRLMTAQIGGTKSILLTAFFFAMMHLQVDQFASIFTLGLVLGYLYDRTQSLWTTIVAHVVFNGVSYAVELGWIGWHSPLYLAFITAVLGVGALLMARSLPPTPVLPEPPKQSWDTSEE
ncbi:CPBP family intramembrane glutamic endopeptidase [Phaeocystidibacter luteus]|uniref:CPBP family intramembrane metalloprotease n=1 Tax=Phaeocystidibacter luteus TaxID=911197 RepID=A0A6N6RKH6_9FLAO|nr:CPBP family intramembrane glutamic endopeptidase [Phaeocystidibacter luteus]KAB2807037.1 CPBP family intramembrane metalloprotease [Phaeocystidibacter luteus]